MAGCGSMGSRQYGRHRSQRLSRKAAGVQRAKTRVKCGEVSEGVCMSSGRSTCIGTQSAASLRCETCRPACVLSRASFVDSRSGRAADETETPEDPPEQLTGSALTSLAGHLAARNQRARLGLFSNLQGTAPPASPLSLNTKLWFGQRQALAAQVEKPPCSAFALVERSPCFLPGPLPIPAPA